jgi:hypothetical protein
VSKCWIKLINKIENEETQYSFFNFKNVPETGSLPAGRQGTSISKDSSHPFILDPHLILNTFLLIWLLCEFGVFRNEPFSME